MVRQRFENYFYEDVHPVLPKYNPNLKAPEGAVPLFNNPFNNQPIFPEIKAKLDFELQDLEFGGRATSVDYQVDGCNVIVRAFGGHGGLIGKFDLTIAYRNPACNAPPPPPLPPEPPHPPIEKWFNLPYTPGATCDAIFGFHVRTRFKQIQSIAGGVKFYQKTLPDFWAACGRFPAGGDEGIYSVTGYEWDYSESEDFCVDELNGFVDYIYGFTYFGDDLVATDGWVKVEFPDIYDYAYFQFPQEASENGIAVNDIPWQLVSSSCESAPPPIPPTFPPPPPRPPMSCCPNVEQNDQLLKLLLAKVKKLSEIVGVDEYPATLPKSFITKKGKNPGTTDVSNLTRLLEWYILRFDELMGQFEIDIEVTDTDLTKEGNQSKTVRLPNLAESIAEMFTLMMQSSINTDLLVNICTRVLNETGQDKQQNFKSHQALMAVIEYLGFNYQEKKENLPLSFKPGEESFDKLLKESTIPVKVVDFHEKETLNHYLHELLQGAAIIRAAHWRKIDPNGDIALQLLDTVYRQQNLRDKVSKLSNEDLQKLVKDLTVPPNKQ